MKITTSVCVVVVVAWIVARFWYTPPPTKAFGPQKLFQFADDTFTADQADQMVRILTKLAQPETGGLKTFDTQDDATFGLGRGYQSYDLIFKSFVLGGYQGNKETMAVTAARNNFVRATLATHNESLVGAKHELGWMLHNKLFKQKAAQLFNTPEELVSPVGLFANVMLPNMEQSIHYDVPEFRGMDRFNTPHWFLRLCHLSGLFEEYRVRTATAVSYFHRNSSIGGEFIVFDQGIGEKARLIPAAQKTSVLLDTDSTMHGVARLSPADTDSNIQTQDSNIQTLPPMVFNSSLRAAAAPLPPGAKEGEEREVWFELFEQDEVEENFVDRFKFSNMRFSVSWKARCFGSEEEKERYFSHSDDLTHAQAHAGLTAEMARRGRLGLFSLSTSPVLPRVPSNFSDWSLAAVRRFADEFVQFPTPPAWLPFNFVLALDSLVPGVVRVPPGNEALRQLVDSYSSYFVSVPFFPGTFILLPSSDKQGVALRIRLKRLLGLHAS